MILKVFKNFTSIHDHINKTKPSRIRSTSNSVNYISKDGKHCNCILIKDIGSIKADKWIETIFMGFIPPQSCIIDHFDKTKRITITKNVCL